MPFLYRGRSELSGPKRLSHGTSQRRPDAEKCPRHRSIRLQKSTISVTVVFWRGSGLSHKNKQTEEAPVIMRKATTLVCTLGLLFHASIAWAASADDQASQILKDTRVQGGLIVHVGCGAGRLTAALRAEESCLVHGLGTSVENVTRARQHIQGLRKYGPVSVGQFDGQHLPYIDNLVNLIVVSDLGTLPRPELMRVLCPGGVSCPGYACPRTLIE